MPVHSPPDRHPDSNANEAAVLKGTAGSVQFISSFAVAAQYGGLYVSTLEAAPKPGGAETTDLVIHQRLYRPWNFKTAASEINTEDVILLRGISGMTIRYFGQQGEQPAASWGEAWTSRAKLPALVVGGSMYSPNARTRMVILNGQVFREGDKPVDGLSVEAIGIKSTVLAFRGVRFELKH